MKHIQHIFSKNSKMDELANHGSFEKIHDMLLAAIMHATPGNELRSRYLGRGAKRCRPGPDGNGIAHVIRQVGQ